MDMGDVFLAGSSARKAIRYARRRNDLVLETNHGLPGHIDRKTCTPGLPDLTSIGIDTISTDHLVDLWFVDHESRLQTKGVRCHVMSASMPVDAFVMIRENSRDGTPHSSCCVHCESPNFSVLTYARELQQHVRKGIIPKSDALIRLVTYVMELLGSYAKDPLDPRHGQDSFGLKPATTKQGLLDFLGRTRRYPCVVIARQAVELALEGAASRMETLTSLVTTLPPRHGGVSLGQVSLNHPIALQDDELRLIKHRSIRPDLLWDPYRLIVEYDGDEFHSAPKQKREDKYRIQDYQTLGYTVLPITYEDVSTIGALDRFLMRLIEVIGRTRGRQYVRNKRRLMKDKTQRMRRAHLLRALLSC